MTQFRTRRTGVVAFPPPPRRQPAPESVPPRDPGETPADPRRLIRGLWLRKGLIVGMTLAMALLLLAAAALMPQRYRATATVMLDPRPQRVVSAQDQVVPDLALTSPLIESEVAVLRSASLMAQVVARIGPEAFGALESGDAGKAPGAAQADTPAAEALHRRIAARLSEGLRVRRVGDSYVIAIAVETPEPQLSARVANGLAEAYIAAQMDGRRRAAASATSWLAGQVARLREELAMAEAAVEAAKRDRLGAGGGTVAVVEQQMAELNRQLALARADRATEEARLAQVERLVAARGPAAAADVDATSGLLALLRQERETLRREEARLARTLGAEHAARRDLAAQIARLDADIAAEVGNIARGHRNEIAVLRIREGSLSAEVAALQRQLADLSEGSLRLRQLEREADAARGGYETLLARLGETRAQVELQRAEARLVEAAQVPEAAVSPRPGLMTAFGATLGLSGGLLAALLLEVAGPGFARAEELAAASGLRVLAVLPRAPRLTAAASVLSHLEATPHSLLAERVRQLRTVLALSRPAERQSLLLVSSTAGEGKTTTCLALAHLYAASGRRVAVLDLDTRRAATRDLPGAEVPPLSLAACLEDPGTLDTAPEAPEGGFDVIAGGPDDAPPGEAPGTERLARLLEALKARYHVVLVDSPPLLAVPDALGIAPEVDRVLYLVRWRHTTQKALAHGLEALQNVGVRPAGAVLSMADERADPDGYAKGYTYG